VIFRAGSTGSGNNDGQHYYAGLYAGSDAVTLGSMDWGWTVLSSASVTVTTNTWYTLRVEASGTTLEVFLDDVLVLTELDSNWSSGSVGLRTYRNKADYASALVCD